MYIYITSLSLKLQDADRQIVEVENQELQAVADALGVPLPPLAVVPHGD